MSDDKAEQDPPTPLKSFGVRLRELRDAHGLTQFQLAQKADCSQGQISRMEKASTAFEARVRPSTVARVAEALGVKALDLEPDERFWLGNEALTRDSHQQDLADAIKDSPYFRAKTRPSPHRGPTKLDRRNARDLMLRALDEALTRAFDAKLHNASDVRDVFAMIEPHLGVVEVGYIEDPEGLTRACRRWLDASVEMRSLRLPLTLVDALFLISMVPG